MDLLRKGTGRSSLSGTESDPRHTQPPYRSHDEPAELISWHQAHKFISPQRGDHVVLTRSCTSLRHRCALRATRSPARDVADRTKYVGPEPADPHAHRPAPAAEPPEIKKGEQCLVLNTAEPVQGVVEGVVKEVSM